MDKSRTYRTFLLTAWREKTQHDTHEPIWRFGLEDVRGKSQKRVFITMEELIEHVKEKLTQIEEFEPMKQPSTNQKEPT